MIFSALLLFAVAAEVFLFLGKDYLLDTRRRASLETSLRQASADLQEAQKRIADKRTDLLAAIEEVEQRRGELQDADRAFAASQKVKPTLVHTLGEVNSGIRFRAPLSKELPATPEASQKVIWTCNNFLDVWASDPAAAREMAEKQFQIKQDYNVGDFAAMPAEMPAPADMRDEAA